MENRTVNTSNAIFDLLAPHVQPATESLTIKIPVDVADQLRAIAYTMRKNTRNGCADVASTLLSSAIADLFAECENRNGYTDMQESLRDARKYRTPEHANRARTQACMRCGQYNDPNDQYCASCSRDLHVVYAECRSCGKQITDGFTYCDPCNDRLRCRVCNECGCVNSVNTWKCENCASHLPSPIMRDSIPVLARQDTTPATDNAPLPDDFVTSVW
jgi:hypothetical protein